MRAGAHALSLLSDPLNVHVVRALADGPVALVDLRRAAGSPPQTTMRGHLKALIEAGIVERHRRNSFPGPLDYELALPGRDLLTVTAVLEQWLALSPEGPLELGTPAAKSATKALVEGWSTSIVRALAATPLSLTELDRLVVNVSYPSLERRLTAMRLAGQIEAAPGKRRGTPYVVTDWLRAAIGPLAIAARWERKHLAAATRPIGRLDIEAAFLLAVPLVSLAGELSGLCRLAVEMPKNGGADSRLSGVMVGIDGGAVTSCASRLEGQADAWAFGSAADWLLAIIERDTQRLEIGGDCAIARGLLDGLNGVLFRSAASG
jgi:DNA-binding HxlR family transcriptional regulator